MVVGNLPILGLALKTGLAVNGVGGEIFSAIKRKEIAAFKEDEWFEDFAPLHMAEDGLEGGSKSFGLYIIEEGSEVGV
jgi:hypothetical protein